MKKKVIIEFNYFCLTQIICLEKSHRNEWLKNNISFSYHFEFLLVFQNKL